jgi:hypothetical protein
MNAIALDDKSGQEELLTIDRASFEKVSRSQIL